MTAPDTPIRYGALPDWQPCPRCGGITFGGALHPHHDPSPADPIKQLLDQAADRGMQLERAADLDAEQRAGGDDG